MAGTNQTPAARRGRRNPDLLTAQPEGQGVDVPETIEEHVDEHELGPEDALIFEGDVVTASVTLAIDLIGDGRTSFIGYKATSRVQPGESDSDVYGRLGTVVRDGVLSAAEDVENGLVAALAAQNERLAAITGGR